VGGAQPWLAGVFADERAKRQESDQYPGERREHWDGPDLSQIL
jgi:hypothetical protein